MKTDSTPPQTLREIELEVEAEGRQWTRQRLQKEAARLGDVFPPQRRGGAGRSVPGRWSRRAGCGNVDSRDPDKAGPSKGCAISER